jgi:hypothetical protein
VCRERERRRPASADENHVEIYRRPSFKRFPPPHPLDRSCIYTFVTFYTTLVIYVCVMGYLIHKGKKEKKKEKYLFPFEMYARQHTTRNIGFLCPGGYLGLQHSVVSSIIILLSSRLK